MYAKQVLILRNKLYTCKATMYSRWSDFCLHLACKLCAYLVVDEASEDKRRHDNQCRAHHKQERCQRYGFLWYTGQCLLKLQWCGSELCLKVG